jgi:hypothetical protein
MPISLGLASFAIRQYPSYLLITDTVGIDKCSHWDILIVYTDERGQGHGSRTVRKGDFAVRDVE